MNAIQKEARMLAGVIKLMEEQLLEIDAGPVDWRDSARASMLYTLMDIVRDSVNNMENENE